MKPPEMVLATGICCCQKPSWGQKSHCSFLLVASKPWAWPVGLLLSSLKAKSPGYAILHFHFKAAEIFSLWSLVSARLP